MTTETSSSDADGRRVALDVQGGIATLTLCREPMNAVDDTMLAALEEAFTTVEANPDIVVMRIRSDQRVFCAGADLKLVGSRLGTPEGTAAMVATVRSFHRVYDRLAALPKLTIAEIEGAALGGGLELALACDLRIASHQAKLGLPETRVGLLPGAGGTQRLTTLCGPGVAARMILSGEIVDGQEAERIGLVQWSADAAGFAALAESVAGRAAGLSVEALTLSKACIRLAKPISAQGVAAEIAGIGTLMTTRSTKARVDAFLSR